MRRSIIFSFIVLLLILFNLQSNAQSIHLMGFENEKGENTTLNSFKGKKILIVIVQNDDDLKLDDLKYAKNYEKLVTLVFMMNDALFSNWNYKYKYDDSIIKGINIGKRKNKNTILLDLLTKSELNGAFRVDDINSNNRFLFDEQGFLYSILPPKVLINSPVFEKLVSRQSLN